MSTPIPYDYRAQIVRLRKSGKTYPLIATLVPCSERSIKRIWRRYLQEGDEGLLTKYHQSGRPSSYGQAVRELVALEKTGEQGAPYIRSVLMEKHPGLDIPHERTLQRWWSAQGINRPKGRPKEKSTWTEQANHTWQIDGKEQVCLGNDQQVSWMKVADEATGSDLLTRLFPQRQGGLDKWLTSLPVHQ
jgi:hypothetical protein